MDLQRAVRQNFEEKASYVARSCEGMAVHDQGSFIAVDSGLPTDTFNVCVVRDLSDPATILAQGVDPFTARAMPMALWYWERESDRAGIAALVQQGLAYSEVDTAMYADLSAIQRTPIHVAGLSISKVTTPEELLEYSDVLVDLFGDSDEAPQVGRYYSRIAESLGMFPAMCYYIGRFHGRVVATGLLFFGSETVGIYDIVTRPEYRNRGIGSAMFQHLLAEALAGGGRHCVLQASKAGLGIYLKAGFVPAGDVYVFENRRLIL